MTEEAKPTGDLFKRLPLQGNSRNPDRIPHMVNLMLAVWTQHPDMRMGQLLMTVSRLAGHGPDDIWNVEEEVFAKGFLRMINMDLEERKGRASS